MSNSNGDFPAVGALEPSRQSVGSDPATTDDAATKPGPALESGATRSKPDLFPALRTAIIQRASKLDGLFKGFKAFRGISFGVSPEVVLELYQELGFERIEFILGENLTESCREQYSKERSVLEKLTVLMEEERVRILVPKKGTTIHTKLYLLEDGAGQVRFVETSSNLTRTGVSGKQINHAIYADLPRDHPFILALQRDYEAHAGLCEPFLGDLLDLIKKEKDRSRAIDAWLAASSPGEDVERKKLVAGVFASALDVLERNPNAQVTLELPQDREASKSLRTHLVEPAGGRQLGERTYEFDAGTLATQFQRSVAGMPLMRVDAQSRRVILWSDGRLHDRVGSPADAPEVGRWLSHLERYVDTIQFGKTANPAMARTAVWEALLSTLSAPFAHEEMKAIRRAYRTEVISRGPSIICVHGPSHNGKTTFLKFALKLICGFPVEPLAGREFTPARVRAYTAMGNLFPLVFDDIPTTATRSLETVVKGYWEQGGWNPELPHPQLVVTTNREAFKSWAKSRLKLLAFDIEYDRSSEGTKALSALFEEPNDIFRPFARLYCESLASDPEDVLEDPVRRARGVFLRLYALAGRRMPPGFPERPFEETFDHEKRRWQELLRLGKAKVVRKGEELCIEFDPGFQPYEIVEYDQMLPQGIKTRRHANLLKVESPREFEAWLGRESFPGSVWSRLWGRLWGGRKS